MVLSNEDPATVILATDLKSVKYRRNGALNVSAFVAMFNVSVIVLFATVAFIATLVFEAEVVLLPRFFDRLSVPVLFRVEDKVIVDFRSVPLVTTVMFNPESIVPVDLLFIVVFQVPLI